MAELRWPPELLPASAAGKALGNQQRFIPSGRVGGTDDERGDPERELLLGLELLLDKIAYCSRYSQSVEREFRKQGSGIAESDENGNDYAFGG